MTGTEDYQPAAADIAEIVADAIRDIETIRQQAAETLKRPMGDFHDPAEMAELLRRALEVWRVAPARSALERNAARLLAFAAGRLDVLGALPAAGTAFKRPRLPDTPARRAAFPDPSAHGPANGTAEPAPEPMHPPST